MPEPPDSGGEFAEIFCAFYATKWAAYNPRPVLSLAAPGNSNKRIGVELSINEDTLRGHMTCGLYGIPASNPHQSGGWRAARPTPSATVQPTRQEIAPPSGTVKP